MIRFNSIQFVVVALLVSATLHAPVSQPRASSASTNAVQPLLKLDNVPIETVIENLARQAGINYLIAPGLEQKWAKSPPPPVSATVPNAVIKDVLLQILSLRHVALLEDPVSKIALIVPEEEAGNPLFAGLPASGAALHTNGAPLIQFSDVPIERAVEVLGQQDGFNYMVDPKLARMWNDPAFADKEPYLSIRLENVTVWAMLKRILCLRYLVMVEDPVTGVSRITFSGGRPPVAVDASLLDAVISNTNPLPIMRFSAVPLATALDNLIKQGGAKIELDPLLSDYSDPQNQPPDVDVNWTNLTARQAIIALCENYGLVLVKDDTTGEVHIKPFEVKRRRP